MFKSICGLSGCSWHLNKTSLIEGNSRLIPEFLICINQSILYKCDWQLWFKSWWENIQLGRKGTSARTTNDHISDICTKWTRKKMALMRDTIAASLETLLHTWREKTAFAASKQKRYNERKNQIYCAKYIQLYLKTYHVLRVLSLNI